MPENVKVMVKVTFGAPVRHVKICDEISGCISCGSTQNIQLWPHYNGHGNMIGMVFACDKCTGIVTGVTMDIHGIRGKDSGKDTKGAGDE